MENYAYSSLGKEKCAKLLPMDDIDEIESKQKETEAALSRIYAKGSLAMNGIPDINNAIKLLEVGSSLLAGELLKISSVLTGCLKVKAYGGKQKDEESSDVLSELFDTLEPLSPLNNEIMRCILAEDEIADDASAELRSIRKKMKVVNDKIKDELHSLLNSNDARNMLQDTLVVMRNGRYCLPVKQEHKGNFQGMIHDQSAKGTTVFMEPLSVVKLNNELSELAFQEEKEIEKILARLSSEAAVYVVELKNNIDTLSELDFIFARGTLAKEMNASKPLFNKEGYINLKKARHPLIDKHKVVPTDIYLGDDAYQLIITGPNTGGKTVTLKTVGLLTLLGQSGLHIPAFDGSKLAVFDEVFADIGDEQSIEQSLSTFSSHMTNTVSILKQSDDLVEENKQVMVLFDELGAGTDPTEGAALATSILTHLRLKNIRTFATTHYAELKVYALSTKYVKNACCDFDVNTLRPTYKLLIGIPGKSNAFAISSKLGLDDSVIELAKKFIGEKEKSFEDVISELDRKRYETEKALEEALQAKKDAEHELLKVKELREKTAGSRDKILRNANEEAQNILRDAKEYVDKTMKKIAKFEAEGWADLTDERDGLNKRLKKRENANALTGERATKTHTKEDFVVGCTVKVLTLGQEATVLSAPNAKDEVKLQMGALTTTMNIKNLEILKQPKKEENTKLKSNSGNTKLNKAMSMSTEINMIGMRVDEAMPLLEKFLDDAYLAGLEKVRIIHGRGTGALMKATTQVLKKNKYIKEFKFAEYYEGDRGATVAEFKR
ncbi:MAG: endonuclease MutS2 [Lachnospiraceae bacterium]|nr:endonuclease MutS2 [Lachnospiraceae bacterium]